MVGGDASEDYTSRPEVGTSGARASGGIDGLPGREWYRHQIYAPGLYTGYGAKTLPGVREAVEAGRLEEANQQARRVAQALKAMATQIEESARLLRQAAGAE